MTKEVFVSISGLQVANGDNEGPIEIISSGEYSFRNDKHYILYDEVTEGFSDVTKNVIKISKDCVEITKKGVSNVHMLFEKNKKNMTYYYTPFGSILIGLDAKKIQTEESETHIHTEIEYGLDINYEYLANCYISLDVKSKDAGDFSLS